CAIGFITNW
nr:immunoglobulin heavy chain junction region [Mus musculus]